MSYCLPFVERLPSFEDCHWRPKFVGADDWGCPYFGSDAVYSTGELSRRPANLSGEELVRPVVDRQVTAVRIPELVG